MNKNIEKARLLYLEKGVLKRELIRDEIVYSWVRSRLNNLSPDSTPSPSIPQKHTLDESLLINVLHINELSIPLDRNKIHTILHLSSTGEILDTWINENNIRYYFNFSEESIGTNAIGLTLRNNEKSFVSGHEHYHKYLTDVTTIGLPTSDNGALGIILNDENVTQDILERLPQRIDIENLLRTKKEPSPKNMSDSDLEKIEMPACLEGNSEIMKKVREKVSQLMDSPLIFISGSDGTGKESLAHYIHDACRNDGAFTSIYCDKIPLKRFKSEWLDDSEKCLFSDKYNELSHYTTFYFENFDMLPIQFQQKFVRHLDSKLVNRTDEQTGSAKDLKFILSVTFTNERVSHESMLSRGLKSRLSMVEISLPKIKSHLDDMSQILDHMIRDKYKDSAFEIFMKNSKVVDIIMDYEWMNNLRGIDNFLNLFREEWLHTENIGFEEVKHYCEQVNLTRQAYELKSLLEIEKDAIINTLIYMEFNMMRSAKILGVSRSTLYRKLEQYNIEVEKLKEIGS